MIVFPDLEACYIGTFVYSLCSLDFRCVCLGTSAYRVLMSPLVPEGRVVILPLSLSKVSVWIEG